MTSTTHNAESLLDALDTAAREQFTDAELDAATARFRSRLPSGAATTRTAASARRSFPRWLTMTGALATLVMTVTVVSLLLPGKNAGSAFAQAQAWFETYETLQLEQVARQDRQELYRMRVWHQRGGATRIEIPPITQVVDPVQGELVIALPNGEIMRQSLPVPSPPLGDREELAWLDELRRFQGQAERLPAPLDMDGVAAEGWRLELSGMQHTLWVDPADHRPLRLDGQLGGGVRMETRFTFDEALPATIFTIPGSE